MAQKGKEVNTILIKTAVGDFEIEGKSVEVYKGYVIVYAGENGNGKVKALFYQPYSVIPRENDERQNND